MAPEATDLFEATALQPGGASHPQVLAGTLSDLTNSGVTMTHGVANVSKETKNKAMTKNNS